MENDPWLRDDADPQLEGLFAEDPQVVGGAIRDLLDCASEDPEVEELLVETLQRSLDEENDDTLATSWLILMLGELRSGEALGPLILALSSDDETLVSGAVRALHKLGRPAFEAVLERLEEDPDIDAASYVAGTQVLEGVALHDAPDLRERVEDTLRGHLIATRTTVGASPAPPLSSETLQKTEAAALALAHLGHAAAGPEIEALLTEVCPGNAFVEEAKEILAERPEGTPQSLPSWQTELRWAFGGVGDDDDDYGFIEAEQSEVGPETDLTVSENPNERVVHVRLRGTDAEDE